jgi:alkanesulfonate monooxygenase SsuD/methylene tetrahydromethanopterin reductase-like flavin-dependent oxidoreductase (luciferase family)
MMQLIYFAGQTGRIGEFDRLVAVAVETGYAGVYVTDHLVPPNPRHDRCLDPWALAARVAARFPEVEVGIMAVNVGAVSIGALARHIHTLRESHGGPVAVGLGAGWHEPDFLESETSMPHWSRRVERLVLVASRLSDQFSTARSGVSLILAGRGRAIRRAAFGLDLAVNCWNFTPDLAAPTRNPRLHSSQAIIFREADRAEVGGADAVELARHGAITSDKALTHWVSMLEAHGCQRLLVPDFHMAGLQDRSAHIRQLGTHLRGL